MSGSSSCAYPQSHAVGTDQCAIFRIVATVIDYFSLLVTACPRLFTYHCLAPVLAGKNEHRLVLFAGKSEHHLDLINMCFTPTNFYVHGSQVKVHPGARACGFRFRHQRTYVRMHTHTDTTNCKVIMTLKFWGGGGTFLLGVEIPARPPYETL